jgi:hypothetical protein
MNHAVPAWVRPNIWPLAAGRASAVEPATLARDSKIIVSSIAQEIDLEALAQVLVHIAFNDGEQHEPGHVGDRLSS